MIKEVIQNLTKMKTGGAKYIISDENHVSSIENRAATFENTLPDDISFSYVFTMDGEELLQQKVYNYNKHQNIDLYQNSSNNNNADDETFNDKHFINLPRDRLSSVASTVDEVGSDEFIVNNDGETSFRRCLNSDDDQDCYIIEHILSTDDDNNDNYKTCNDKNSTTDEELLKQRHQNDDLNYKSIHLEFDEKVRIPYAEENKTNFVQIDEELLKVCDNNGEENTNNEKPSTVNDIILTLFDNVTVIKSDAEYTDENRTSCVDENRKMRQDKNFNYYRPNIGYQNNETVKNVICNKNFQNRHQSEYFTRWYSEEISTNKDTDQTSSELLMIDCDESSLTINEDSSAVNNNNNNNFDIRGYKSYHSSCMNYPQYNRTLIQNNNNNNHSPLPPIETMLRQGARTISFNSVIRKNSSSLNSNTKISDNENGEFGHLSCGQLWQKSSMSDISSNKLISDNQVVVSQSDSAIVDALPRIKDEIPAGLLECRWEDCWALFQGQSALVRHIEKTHVELRRGEDFACLWQACPRRTRPFNARYKLLIHMRVHSGEKPNKCPFQGCLKAFSRLENLKIHQRSHTGERPYACQFQGCPKAFSNSSDRAKHQRTHFDTKPYACQVIGCNKRYTDPSSLRKHIKNHGGMSTGRTKKLVASEPIVSPNELKARQRCDSSCSLPSPAAPESPRKMEVKNEPEISNEMSTITDISEAINEFIPYESVHHLLDEDCIDPSSWEEEMSAEIERQFLSLTSDYNSSLMDLNEDNDNDESNYR